MNCLKPQYQLIMATILDPGLLEGQNICTPWHNWVNNQQIKNNINHMYICWWLIWCQRGIQLPDSIMKGSDALLLHCAKEDRYIVVTEIPRAFYMRTWMKNSYVTRSCHSRIIVKLEPKLSGNTCGEI